MTRLQTIQATMLEFSITIAAYIKAHSTPPIPDMVIGHVIMPDLFYAAVNPTEPIHYLLMDQTIDIVGVHHISLHGGSINTAIIHGMLP